MLQRKKLLTVQRLDDSKLAACSWFRFETGKPVIFSQALELATKRLDRRSVFNGTKGAEPSPNSGICPIEAHEHLKTQAKPRPTTKKTTPYLPETDVRDSRRTSSEQTVWTGFRGPSLGDVTPPLKNQGPQFFLQRYLSPWFKIKISRITIYISLLYL